jgi:hypothetical protein
VKITDYRKSYSSVVKQQLMNLAEDSLQKIHKPSEQIIQELQKLRLKQRACKVEYTNISTLFSSKFSLANNGQYFFNEDQRTLS